jgi:hypothetical protein
MTKLNSVEDLAQDRIIGALRGFEVERQKAILSSVCERFGVVIEVSAESERAKESGKLGFQAKVN